MPARWYPPVTHVACLLLDALQAGEEEVSGSGSSGLPTPVLGRSQSRAPEGTAAAVAKEEAALVKEQEEEAARATAAAAAAKKQQEEAARAAAAAAAAKKQEEEAARAAAAAAAAKKQEEEEAAMAAAAAAAAKKQQEEEEEARAAAAAAAKKQEEEAARAAAAAAKKQQEEEEAARAAAAAKKQEEEEAARAAAAAAAAKEQEEKEAARAAAAAAAKKQEEEAARATAAKKQEEEEAARAAAATAAAKKQEEEEAARAAAARRIQAIWRGSQQRASFLAARSAAVMVQRAWRTHVILTRARALAERRLAELEQQRWFQDQAASAIQRSWRASVLRRSLGALAQHARAVRREAAQHAAATRIQALWRGYSARKSLSAMLSLETTAVALEQTFEAAVGLPASGAPSPHQGMPPRTFLLPSPVATATPRLEPSFAFASAPLSPPDASPSEGTRAPPATPALAPHRHPPPPSRQDAAADASVSSSGRRQIDGERMASLKSSGSAQGMDQLVSPGPAASEGTTGAAAAAVAVASAARLAERCPDAQAAPPLGSPAAAAAAGGALELSSLLPSTPAAPPPHQEVVCGGSSVGSATPRGSHVAGLIALYAALSDPGSAVRRTLRSVPRPAASSSSAAAAAAGSRVSGATPSSASGGLLQRYDALSAQLDSVLKVQVSPPSGAAALSEDGEAPPQQEEEEQEATRAAPAAATKEDDEDVDVVDELASYMMDAVGRAISAALTALPSAEPQLPELDAANSPAFTLGSGGSGSRRSPKVRSRTGAAAAARRSKEGRHVAPLAAALPANSYAARHSLLQLRGAKGAGTGATVRSSLTRSSGVKPFAPAGPGYAAAAASGAGRTRNSRTGPLHGKELAILREPLPVKASDLLTKDVLPRTPLLTRCAHVHTRLSSDAGNEGLEPEGCAKPTAAPEEGQDRRRHRSSGGGSSGATPAGHSTRGGRCHVCRQGERVCSGWSEEGHWQCRGRTPRCQPSAAAAGATAGSWATNHRIGRHPAPTAAARRSAVPAAGAAQSDLLLRGLCCAAALPPAAGLPPGRPARRSSAPAASQDEAPWGDSSAAGSSAQEAPGQGPAADQAQVFGCRCASFGSTFSRLPAI